jgi:hypothetical protein
MAIGVFFSDALRMFVAWIARAQHDSSRNIHQGIATLSSNEYKYIAIPNLNL